jgi:hypothetical protein
MPVVQNYTALLADSLNETPGKGVFYTYSFSVSAPNYLLETYTAEQLSTFRPLSDSEKAVRNGFMGSCC